MVHGVKELRYQSWWFLNNKENSPGTQDWIVETGRSASEQALRRDQGRRGARLFTLGVALDEAIRHAQAKGPVFIHYDVAGHHWGHPPSHKLRRDAAIEMESQNL